MSSYDERLLESAPAATRQEKQEGYNVDLLGDSREAGSSSPEVSAPLPSNHGHAEAGLASKEDLRSYPPARPVPWWRTKKFIIFAVVLAVVAVAAIVGGAVGGTVHHHSSNNNNPGAAADSSSSKSTVTSISTSAAAPASSDGSPGIAGNPGAGQGVGVTSTSSVPSDGPGIAPGATSPTSSNDSPNAVTAVNLAKPTSDAGAVLGGAD